MNNQSKKSQYLIEGIGDVSLIKKIARQFQPKTKFTSLFGAIDTVSDKDEFYVDQFGEVYILGMSGKFRLIFNGKYWAEIITLKQ